MAKVSSDNQKVYNRFLMLLIYLKKYVQSWMKFVEIFLGNFSAWNSSNISTAYLYIHLMWDFADLIQWLIVQTKISWKYLISVVIEISSNFRCHGATYDNFKKSWKFLFWVGLGTYQKINNLFNLNNLLSQLTALTCNIG